MSPIYILPTTPTWASLAMTWSWSHATTYLVLLIEHIFASLLSIDAETIVSTCLIEIRMLVDPMICKLQNIAYGFRKHIGWWSFWSPNYIQFPIIMVGIFGSHEDARPTPTTANTSFWTDYYSSQEIWGTLFDSCSLTCSSIAFDLFYSVKPQILGVKNDDTEPRAEYTFIYEGDKKREYDSSLWLI